ncbi:PPE domain-containing protein [Mycobacterium malmoense]|uniref:PPE domain-containing protein n=1 Tax=Mycobacterium malmoense TaxID=1780 RepID=UPI0008F842C1|nr:PPE domain-containing protein [Mycobacterium malmoense]OIN79330.1 hypothetical protein BMG05_18765 [Mycobacterium malmoense]
MTAPVWIASPPEVHSALLSSGPGPGPLLVASATWNSLSVEYASVAEELSAVLASVRASAWEGPTAEAFEAAYVPYLTWLTQASANSAATAAQQETVATAYIAALTAMPTLAELAANHATHAVLVATNFFGINAIPITLNEADYVWMWIQAATVMNTYEVVSEVAVTSAPHSTAAPAIVKANAPAAGGPPMQPPPDPGAGPFYAFFTVLDELIQQIIPAQDVPLIGQLFSPFTSPAALAQLVASIDTLEAPTLSASLPIQSESVSVIVSFGQGLIASAGPEYIVPVSLLVAYLVGFHVTLFILQDLHFLVSLPLIQALLVPLATAPLAAIASGGFAGCAGLAGLAAIPTGVETIPIAPIVVPQPVVSVAPVLSPAPTPAPSPTLAPAPASAPAPAPAPTAPTAAGAAPPPAAGPGPFPYLVGGGLSMDYGASDQASTKKKAPEPDIAAAAAAATPGEQARARRRRKAKVEMLGRGYEYMDLEPEPEGSANGDQLSAVASNVGGGLFGLVGTAGKGIVEAAGLTTLAGEAFGDGPGMPMVPSSWDYGLAQPGPAGKGGDDS